ncbi:MAG TPA: DUF1761 domain-containing protein [Gammaproteobacteria bacterium]|nr:DUF1761 domain-containing protein [Gammaproteobacteria bacterium]
MGYLHINFLAAVVAAVVAFGLGWLWYSPILFGKQWVAWNGYTPEKIQVMQKGMLKAYGISFACFLVMSMLLAVLMRICHISAVVAGAKLGFLCWLAFVATTGLTASVYSDRSLKAWSLDAGYQLVYLVVMGVILAAWH